ncbi:MAG: NifU family protein [Bacilli bacterium]|nr:NifU family protein [Bacilli bacterium]
MKNDDKVVREIKKVIERVRPYLKNDGGDVEFKRFENGVVYVSMVGACHNCPMASVTLEDGIESVLINEIPEVIKVVAE